jgi:hypothetical protein
VWTFRGGSLVAWTQDPGKRPQDPGTPAKLRKPQMSDTIKANVYADNWFVLYINGELAAVDSIKFIPHNVISVDLLPTYPMTIAVMAKDNADPKTGMEYANTNIGDGGFVLKFGDGTVTDGTWKAESLLERAHRTRHGRSQSREHADSCKTGSRSTSTMRLGRRRRNTPKKR